jgi:hypothetical protein
MFYIIGAVPLVWTVRLHVAYKGPGASLEMRKRSTIWVLAGCASLAVLMAVLALPTQREPQYGGKKLRDWLELYGQPFDRFKDSQEAADAVRHIGTNALPCLLRWTDYEPPGWKQMLWTNAAVVRMPGYFWLRYRPSDKLNRLGRFGFEILGPQARPALPEVKRRMVDWENPWRATAAMQIYTGIEGPDALPTLLSALANTNAACRISAAFDLAALGTNGAPAVPILRKALNDPDPVVRRYAGAALQIILSQTRGKL